MKPLQGNMSPESIVIVHSAHGPACWVLNEGEGVQDVYAYYAAKYPDCKIRVYYTCVMAHERPVEEVPLYKLTRAPHYMRAEEGLYIDAPLDWAKMLENPISITAKNQVEDGWQRVMMARRDGWTTIPCVMRSR